MGAGWGLSSTSRGRGALNTRPFSSPSSPAPCLSGWAGGPARSLPCRRESQPPRAPLAPVRKRRSIRRLRRLLSPRTGRLQPPPQCGQGKTPHPSQIHPRDGDCPVPHTNTQEKGASRLRAGAGVYPAVVSWEGGGRAVPWEPQGAEGQCGHGGDPEAETERRRERGKDRRKTESKRKTAVCPDTQRRGRRGEQTGRKAGSGRAPGANAGRALAGV